MGGKGRSGLRAPGLGPSDAELDSTNARLHECARLGDLQAFAAEGEIILRDIFGGDVAAWESRSPAKMQSIRRLAKRPGAPYQKDALSKRVGVHVAMQKLAFVWRSPTITASHVVEVLRIPHDERVGMLELVVAEGWSVKRLHAEVVQGRRSRGERRGRRVSPRVRKAISLLRKATQALTRVPALLEPGALLDERSRAELATLVSQLSSLQRRVDAAVSGISPFEARIRQPSSVAAVRPAPSSSRAASA